MAETTTVGAPVVGRERELAVLRDRLARAATGRGGAVLLTGEAGVGKSRLVRQMATEAAADGIRVLEGRSVAVGGEPLRHAALLELMRSARRGPAGGGAGPATLATAAPEELLEHTLTVVDGSTPAAPLLLVVEDVHWADRATCEVLMVLARHVHERAAALVVTCRDDELPRGHHVRGFLAELVRAQLVLTVGLDRLGAAHVAQLIEWLVGPVEPATAAGVFERSGGNPLLVEELCAGGGMGMTAGPGRRAGGGAGSPLDGRLLDVLLARADRLSPAATAVAGVVAAAGRPVDQGTLAEVLSPSGPESEAGLREALDHHLLVRQGDDIAFRHVLVAEAVYGHMLRSERAAVHARWAELLARRDEEPAVLAHHWAQAGDDQRALAASVAAGDTDLLTLRCDSAVAHYRQALALWDGVADPASAAGCDRIELCARAAQAANGAGDPAAAVKLVAMALAELREGGDPVLTSRLRERHGWYLLRTGTTEPAAESYQTAVDMLPADAPPGDQARVRAGAVRIWERQGDAVQAVAAAEQAVALAEAGGGAAEQAQARYMLGRARLLAGQSEAALDELGRAAEAAERCLDAVTLSTALADRADGLAATGRLQLALDEATAAAARLRDAGHADPHALLATGLAGALLHRAGRAAEARRVAETVAAEARTPLTLAVGHLLVGAADLDDRRLGDAREHLEMARFLAAPVLDGRIGGNLGLRRAELALTEGRLDVARAAVDEGIAQVERTGDDEVLGHLCLLGLRIAADRHQLAGDARTSDRAKSRASAAIDRYEHQLTHLTTRPPAPLPIRDGAAAPAHPAPPAAADRADRPAHAAPPTAADRADRPAHAALVAAWAAERTRLDGASDPGAWAESARLWTAMTQAHLAARARMRHAEALQRRPDTRSEAPARLAEALNQAQQIGSRLLTEEIRQVARRAGIALPSSAEPPATGTDDDRASSVAPLTRREREVLELVASGATNRQIAALLYISTKTASVHVSRILAKLGVATRAEAATVARHAAASRTA